MGRSVPDKSLISNLVAALLVLLGWSISGPWQPYVLNTGLFALSGGVTNWLAVHMLFERVPGLYGSGVIQLRFEELKRAIRELIMEQFFDRADLEAYFHEIGDTSERLNTALERAIDGIDLERAFDSLVDVIMNSSFAGMLGMVGGRDALYKLKDPFVERMRIFFRLQLQDRKFHEHIETALRAALDEEAIRRRLQRLIDERLDELTPAMVKEIMRRMIREHLGWLVVWGCAFGGAIGLVVALIASNPAAIVS